LSRRKDIERYLRLKQQNPDYAGYRGSVTVETLPQPELESVICSVCGRKRNVPSDTIPDDRSNFVCMSCQPTDDEKPNLAEGG